MTTTVFDAVRSIDVRIRELRVLLTAARDLQDNRLLYGALCRSISVLLASHLEGFVKDLSRSAIGELNFFRKQFSHMPHSLKRAFCERVVFFEGVDKKYIEKRMAQLLEFFEKNSVAIDLEAFKYLENQNKNAAISSIDETFEKIGIVAIVRSISGGYFEGIFEDSRDKCFMINREIRRRKSLFYKYPYSSPPKLFNICSIDKAKAKERTIWHDYIDAILTRRHAVAHGDSMTNETNHDELENDISKLSVFMHALAYGVAFGLQERRQ